MFVLHGDNVSLSAKKLNQITDEFLANGLSVNSFDQSELTIARLRQELSPTDLFGNSSGLVIRGLLTGAKSKSKDKIIEFLKQNNPPNVILYEPKAIHAATANQFKGATIENFKIDINIFKFMETVLPGNNQNTLKSYKDLIGKGAEPEFIFAMLVRQVRQLILTKNNPGLLKGSPYALRSLQPQAARFSLEVLLKMHSDLYRIEKGIKSGQNPLDLNNLLLHFFAQL